MDGTDAEKVREGLQARVALLAVSWEVLREPLAEGRITEEPTAEEL